MFKNLLSFDSYASLAGIATLLFFIMFAVIVLRTLLLKKGFTKRMSNLPLDTNGTEATKHGDYIHGQEKTC